MIFSGLPRRLFTAALFATLLGGVAFVVPASAHETYVVGPGDTLSEVAQRSGTSVSAIMAENGLANPHRIRIGQQLRLPHGTAAQAVTSVASPASSPGTYTVAPGDTLGHIAIRLGVKRSDLISINGLSNPDRIRIGQKLTVPQGGVVPRATSSYQTIPDRITNDSDRLALIPIFERWSSANNLPVELVMAVAWQESGWNNAAVSSKGAVGIGQIMPATGVWVASDLIGRPELNTSNSEDNIRISARYLRWLIDYLGTEELALAGYYQGPGAVRAGISYTDTERYVANVISLRPLFAPS